MIVADCGHEIESVDDGEEVEVEGASVTYCRQCAYGLNTPFSGGSRPTYYTDMIRNKPEWCPKCECYRNLSHVHKDNSVVAGSPEQLAEAHCAYNVGLYRKAFLDGFTHGFKHGKDSTVMSETH